MNRLGLAVAAILALGLSACDEKKEEAASGTPSSTSTSTATPAPAPANTGTTAAAAGGGAVTDADRAQAKEIFATRCTPCHGPTGKGDGPASAGLTPKPRNLGDAEWQKSVTDDHIEKIISYGGAAVGKSAGMPPNPDLADKPVVKALREHVRSLANQ